ncbi:EamA family transporter [Shewanella sp. VB17]|uniref:EamA family transporter n=1 Tax=Shewanella sp. VB17 TaxID=2739432 RepID=UPI00156497BF|nr:EamA family transporter [Shewanella sp. VB17]NRD73460.1 EamA family transporter [Shewanella sp. VB17]
MKKRDLCLLTALMALWGVNFSVIKLGVNNIDPILLTALRFTFAVFPLIFFIKKPDVKWRYLISYGLTFGIGVWGLTTLAIDSGTSSGMASLLLDMSVVSSLFIGYFFLNEKLSFNKLSGAALALIGLVLIMQEQGGNVSLKGGVLVLVASLFWSINGLIVKRANTRSIFAFNLWAMLFAPLPLLLLAVLTHGMEVMTNLPRDLNVSALFSALFQAYPTTLFGYWLWNKMILKYDLSSVAPMTLLVPVFAILAGYWFYQEAITLVQVLAAVCILLGLFISQLQASIYPFLFQSHANDQN